MPQDLTDGSGNGLVLSGNKTLPEAMLTQSFIAYGVSRPQWVKDQHDHITSDLKMHNYMWIRPLRTKVGIQFMGRSH